MLVAQTSPFLDVSPQVSQGLVSAYGSWEGEPVEMGALSSGNGASHGAAKGGIGDMFMNKT